MSLFSARRLSVVLGGAAAAVWAASCATDAGLGDESGGTGGSPPDGAVESGSGGADASGGGGSSGTAATSGDASPWPGSGIGDPCNTDSECGALDCVDGVCTFPCQPGKGCPSGSFCGFHPVEGYVCVPEGTQCAPCVTADDCPNAGFGDRCAIAPATDRFCARDCSFDDTCPMGSVCVDTATYVGSLAGGGTSDGGVGEAGAPMGNKMCVPMGSDSCPCDAVRDGVTRTCEAMSGGMTCGGTETCDGASGTWGMCTAGTPGPEVCDGADNDCNGTPDDGDPETLCAGMGMPANATWDCDQGQCVVGSCDPGFTNFPPTLPPSAGCPCQVDATEPNETCADAKAVGSVTDANTTPLTISGRLSSANDVDWFTFDIIRGSTCAVPDAAHSNLTEYDWCVDGTGTDSSGATIGEATCGVTAPIHCGPHDKPYLIAVRRKPAATGTCSEYTLKITAKGGTCDFSQATGACDPQVQE